MGVDGISKNALGAVQLDAAESASGVSATKTQTPTTTEVWSSSELHQLQSGQLSLDDYLDLQVGRAVEHLRGAISVEQLEVVQDVLKNELRSDPVLLKLVKQATGHSPLQDS